jgi:hypothetical protein
MRNNYADLPTSEWTDAEAFDHLNGTFDRACRAWPDLMEPYVVDLADAPEDQHKEIMRRGLRETINYRR